ncbi:MAG: bifunctional demethylmenaquinone methyltransferase/2-methoxy-6-polyprenyl-1,4-benzoquinol methylase UbiE [Liquorilactobacillus ghanensis]|jgi:demethylmenaquinone methyltransferase/2-methoxy-6-polyprenyl-1,4-benzoquinol methylase|uniref:Demethylmenaquinone methyltransferase n=1 Tax=Liquorilactobacillus ghanensis DSM 18630 TaxID=1423750 RepID=A0A0R1VT33_9LACO|nr:bifunctional demethylmenaquinone methyltransferase/2-methoxy-6-polyprenyl-1,4-benzoquinol methylase UbiE [Liquorilactobacillus ghanensis]KRM06041.1 menaquinone biosynthesis methyltransferase MenH [Liquorilactobacillus ghanensis DSM 18630]
MGITNPTPPTKVKELFDRLAPNYDRMNNVITLGIQNSWRQQTMNYLRLPVRAQVLDLCCGTGHWTFDLARATDDQSRVTGLDFSPQMLELAQAKLADSTLQSKIKFLQGDAMKLPFADNSFDLVTIGFGLRNVRDAQQVLQEMARVTRPGGQIACLETSKPQKGLLKLGWQVYFSFVPWVAQMYGNRQQDYRYLQKTAQHFPAAPQLAKMFQQAGLGKVEYHSFTFGAGALHLGTKLK